jgi:hypothetical protein
MRLVFKGGKGSGNFGHAGRPGKVGGSVPAGEGSGSSEENNTENDRLAKRPGRSPYASLSDTRKTTYENASVLKGIRAGDKVMFNVGGKKVARYVQGWRGDYFLVTNKSSKRYVNDPAKMNLNEAIHFSDAVRVLDEG